MLCLDTFFTGIIAVQILVPLCSSLGLRALFWPTAFIPDLELSQTDVSSIKKFAFLSIDK